MPGSHYAIFVVKTSVVRLNDERRKSCGRSHYTTARDSLAHTTRHPGHGDPGGLVKTKQCNSAPSVKNTILVMAPFTKQTLLTITAQ